MKRTKKISRFSTHEGISRQNKEPQLQQSRSSPGAKPAEVKMSFSGAKAPMNTKVNVSDIRKDLEYQKLVNSYHKDIKKQKIAVSKELDSIDPPKSAVYGKPLTAI